MQDPQHYERLSGNVGQLAAASAADSDDDDDVFRPEIVPIAEGEVTLGQSGKPTEWPEEKLREATEQGVFDNAKLLKGRPGKNPHKPIDEQAPPDDIVGDAGTFRYEDGRGPVSNGDGVITDDHIARLVEHGLVDISPDTFREVGDLDDDTGTQPVEEVLAVPWMTIVDQGAGPNAELGEAEAEALAALPRADELSDDDGGTEQLARLQFLRFWPSAGGFEAADPDELQAAADAVDTIGGVDAILRAPLDADGEPQNPELLAVLSPETADLGTLNADLRDALAETPFAVDDGYNWVADLEHEHLAAGTEHSQLPIGADADPSDPADSTTMADDNTTKEELHEQLAAARSELDEQEDQIENLQDDKEDLEATKEELESEKEDLEDENENLKENNETFQRALAARYAEESPMDAESAMDRLSVDDMVEDLDEGPDGDDDDRSPKERLSEQLAAGIEMRGSGTDDPAGGGGGLSDDDLEQAEQLAGSVLSLNDIQRIEGEDISRREYLKREEDVDPAEYGSESSLRTAIAEGGD